MARAAAQVAYRCTECTDGNLDLSDCDLCKFPDGVFMLTASMTIVRVSLAKNQLQAITARVPQKWPDIQDLDISENLLSALPDQLAELSHLHTLNLHGNQFSHVPLVVFRMSTLKSLIASNNKIDAVAAEELKSMENLKYVDLRENPLSDSLKSQLMEREDWKLLI